MAEKHEHGTMNVDAQHAAFDGFIRWSIRVIIFSICALLFMAIFNS